MGGELGLWSSNDQAAGPGKLVKKVTPKFNRAVFFDTTQNSWHGLPDPIECPNNRYRKSLALYYLTTPPLGAEKRGKALFSPTEKQKNDPEILKLIQMRSSIDNASSVYGDK